MDPLNLLTQALSRAAAVIRQRGNLSLVAQSDLFSADWYSKTYPDAITSGMSPSEHYLTSTRFERRWPGPSFSPARYLAENPDLPAVRLDPFVHYLRFGIREGRPIGGPWLTPEGDLRVSLAGVLDETPDVSDLSQDRAKNIATVAAKLGLTAVCVSVADLGSLNSLRNLADLLTAEGIKIFVNLAGSATSHDLKGLAALGDLLASMFLTERYFAPRGRPLVLVDLEGCPDQVSLRPFAEALDAPFMVRPFYAAVVTPSLESPAAEVFRFDCTCEESGHFVDTTTYPDQLYTAFANVNSFEYPAIPRLRLNRNGRKDMEDRTTDRYYSTDLLEIWARRGAGIAMDPAAPGVVLIPIDGFVDGPPGEQLRSEAHRAVEVALKYPAEWRHMLPPAGVERKTLEKLNSMFMGSPRKPILIYQMGKVGSTSVHEPLARTVRKEPVFHIHALNDLDERVMRLRKRGSVDIGTVRHLYDCRDVRDWMEGAGEQTEWRIITMVRNPVPRTISHFFHNLFDVRPGYKRDWQAGRFSVSEIRKLLTCFALDPDTHVDRWWERELRAVFGVDVFGSPFPIEKGFSFYSSGQARVLLIRTENLNSKGEQAVSEFLDVPFVFEGIRNQKRIGRAAQTESVLDSEKDSEIATEMETALREEGLPGRLLDFLLSTKTAQHFYTESERDEMRQHWQAAAP